MIGIVNERKPQGCAALGFLLWQHDQSGDFMA